MVAAITLGSTVAEVTPGSHVRGKSWIRLDGAVTASLPGFGLPWRGGGGAWLASVGAGARLPRSRRAVGEIGGQVRRDPRVDAVPLEGHWGRGRWCRGRGCCARSPLG